MTDKRTKRFVLFFLISVKCEVKRLIHIEFGKIVTFNWTFDL